MFHMASSKLHTVAHNSVVWHYILIPVIITSLTLLDYFLASLASPFSVALSIDVDRAPTFLLVVKLLIVGDSLVIVQALETVLVDGGKVHKDVLAAIVGCDEAVALFTEELDLSGVFGHEAAGSSCGSPRRKGHGRCQESDRKDCGEGELHDEYWKNNKNEKVWDECESLFDDFKFLWL
jgi:hypothetical protein